MFLAAALLVFGIYNIIWFFAAYRVIADMEDEIPEYADSGKHIYIDDEGYIYSVKKPDYLRWTGNVSIVQDDSEIILIIWPGIMGQETEAGVIIMDSDENMVQVKLGNSYTAENSEYQTLVDENQELISDMLEKAGDFWGLEFEQ